MSVFDGNDLVFNNDIKEGIHSGGFSVNSIMMREGLSPIMTMNMNKIGGGDSDKVSDLFDSLVVPAWAFSYNKNMIGGNDKERNIKQIESDDEDDTVDDDLHDKLLDLVKEHDIKTKQNKKHGTRKNIKNSKSVSTNKKNTRKRK
jgi:hypothetical protein